jgi:hypothetical protein
VGAPLAFCAAGSLGRVELAVRIDLTLEPVCESGAGRSGGGGAVIGGGSLLVSGYLCDEHAGAPIGCRHGTPRG